MATSSKLSVSKSNAMDDIENLNCPICLEVFHEPRKITCGHVFCKSCLANYEDILSPACPICRQLFEISASKKAKDIAKIIKNSSWQCRTCSQKVPLSKLRYHNSTCSNLIGKTKKLALDAEQGEEDQVASASKCNRYTFRCPYCGLQNLETHTLAKHCNETHFNHPGQVVCPICSSMPWGDRKLKSSNFLAHLNMRHKFEYEFVVDFDLNDDEALEKALKASLEEQ